MNRVTRFEAPLIHSLSPMEETGIVSLVMMGGNRGHLRSRTPKNFDCIN